MNGTRPVLPESKAQSQDVGDSTLRELINQCFEQEPRERPRACVVADILSTKLASISIHHIENIDEKQK